MGGAASGQRADDERHRLVGAGRDVDLARIRHVTVLAVAAGQRRAQRGEAERLDARSTTAGQQGGDVHADGWQMRGVGRVAGGEVDA